MPIIESVLDKIKKVNKKRDDFFKSHNYDIVQDFSDVSNISVEVLKSVSENLSEKEIKSVIKNVLYSKKSNTQMLDYILQDESFSKNLDDEDNTYISLKMNKIKSLKSQDNSISDQNPENNMKSLFEEGGDLERFNENKDFVKKCLELEELTEKDLKNKTELLLRDLKYWKIQLQYQLIECNYDRMDIIDSTMDKIRKRLLTEEQDEDTLALKYKKDTIWGSKIYMKDENQSRIPILEISFYRKEVTMPTLPRFDSDEENKKVYDTMALAARSKGIVKPKINVAETAPENRREFVESTIMSLLDVGGYRLEDIEVPPDCVKYKDRFRNRQQGITESTEANTPESKIPEPTIDSNTPQKINTDTDQEQQYDHEDDRTVTNRYKDKLKGDMASLLPVEDEKPINTNSENETRVPFDQTIPETNNNDKKAQENDAYNDEDGFDIDINSVSPPDQHVDEKPVDKTTNNKKQESNKQYQGDKSSNNEMNSNTVPDFDFDDNDANTHEDYEADTQSYIEKDARKTNKGTETVSNIDKDQEPKNGVSEETETVHKEEDKNKTKTNEELLSEADKRKQKNSKEQAKIAKKKAELTKNSIATLFPEPSKKNQNGNSKPNR